MIIKIDMKHSNGKIDSVIFGHAKGGKDYKEKISFYLAMLKGNHSGKEASFEVPKILKIEQAEGHTSKDFRWCGASRWNATTSTTYPRFKETTSRTEGAVKKIFDGKIAVSKAGKSVKKPSKPTTASKPKKRVGDEQVRKTSGPAG